MRDARCNLLVPWIVGFPVRLVGVAHACCHGHHGVAVHACTGAPSRWGGSDSRDSSLCRVPGYHFGRVSRGHSLLQRREMKEQRGRLFSKRDISEAKEKPPALTSFEYAQRLLSHRKHHPRAGEFSPAVNVTERNDSRLGSSFGDKFGGGQSESNVNVTTNSTATRLIALSSPALVLLQLHEGVHRINIPVCVFFGFIIFVLLVIVVVCYMRFNTVSWDTSALEKPQHRSQKHVQFCGATNVDFTPPVSHAKLSSKQTGNSAAARNYVPLSKDPALPFHAYPLASRVSCPPVSNLTLLDAKRRLGPGVEVKEQRLAANERETLARLEAAHAPASKVSCPPASNVTLSFPAEAQLGPRAPISQQRRAANERNRLSNLEDVYSLPSRVSCPPASNRTLPSHANRLGHGAPANQQRLSADALKCFHDESPSELERVRLSLSEHTREGRDSDFGISDRQLLFLAGAEETRFSLPEPTQEVRDSDFGISDRDLLLAGVCGDKCSTLASMQPLPTLPNCLKSESCGAFVPRYERHVHGEDPRQLRGPSRDTSAGRQDVLQHRH